MPKAQLSAGNVIHYEDSAIDSPEHIKRPALLLIQGLGMQLIGWPESLVARFIERGFRVILADNRDIGLSSFFDHLGPPPILRCTICSFLGLPVGRVPYTLADMAQDAVGVLDACKVQRAHVIGASMGGMIGQWMAIAHPDRVLSLTSVMSSTGAFVNCRHISRIIIFTMIIKTVIIILIITTTSNCCFCRPKS
jgi:pimeloyl-ACP methyl ester carboxylesterase